ncbi:MAG: NAD(P)/FAD-dependent oxidoreductase [Planktomarina sp.]
MRAGVVTKLPIDPGPSGWNAILPSADDPYVLDQNITADWLIIGAGFAGLAAARRLTQICPDDKIVVVDAVRLGTGPAGRNSGFMIDLPHDLASADYGGALETDKTLTADNRFAIDFAAQMATDFNLRPSVFSQSGKVNGAATAKGQAHNTAYAGHLDAMAEPYDMLDAADMKSLTGSSYYQGGLYTAGTAIIQPAAFVRGVAAGLKRCGVHIYENTPVVELTKKQNWIAKTPRATVTAPKVILAVNGHLNSFGHMKGRLMHVFTYASMTAPLPGTHPIFNITPADPMGTSVRRIHTSKGDRLVIRNRFTFDPSMEVSNKRIAHVAKDHEHAFQNRFPQMANVEMEYRWGGRLCLSRNNVNLVRELDTGLYAACVQNGLGTTRGTLGGVLAAEMAMNMQSPRLNRALSSQSPTRLPPRAIAQPGANAYLRWLEYKAGAEL